MHSGRFRRLEVVLLGRIFWHFGVENKDTASRRVGCGAIFDFGSRCVASAEKTRGGKL